MAEKLCKDRMDSKGSVQIHLWIPNWLLERIKNKAEAMGQTPSSEIRRALVEVFGTKGIEESTIQGEQ